MINDHVSIKIVTESSPDIINLVIFGDLHYGVNQSTRWLVKQGVQYALDTPHTYAVLVGDNFDLPMPGKHADGTCVSPDKSAKQFEEDLLPLAKAGKLLGSVDGNHDGRITKIAAARCDMTQQKFDTWNNLLGYAGTDKEILYNSALLLDFKAGRHNFAGLIHHNIGNLTKASILKAMAFMHSIDFVASGHNHEEGFMPRALSYYDRQKKKIIKRPWCMIKVGGTPDDMAYAVKMGLSATLPSYTIVKLIGGRPSSHKDKKKIKYDSEWAY